MVLPPLYFARGTAEADSPESTRKEINQTRKRSKNCGIREVQEDWRREQTHRRAPSRPSISPLLLANWLGMKTRGEAGCSPKGCTEDLPHLRDEVLNLLWDELLLVGLDMWWGCCPFKLPEWWKTPQRLGRCVLWSALRWSLHFIRCWHSEPVYWITVIWRLAAVSERSSVYYPLIHLRTKRVLVFTSDMSLENHSWQFVYLVVSLILGEVLCTSCLSLSSGE